MFKLQICDPSWKGYNGVTGEKLYKWALDIAKESQALEDDRYYDEGFIVISDDSLKETFKNSQYRGRGLAVIGMGGFEPDKPEITFRFDSIEEASAFKSYMCDGGGEQGFFDVDEETYEETYYTFDYHDPGGSVVVVKKAK